MDRLGLAAGLAAGLLLISCNPTAQPKPEARSSASGKPNVISTASWLVADRDRLHFRYPVGWYENHGSFVSSFTNLVVSVSNQPLHDPCQPTAPSGFRCGAGIDGLGAGGMIAEWRANGFPGWRFDDQPGVGLQVDGRTAKLKEGATVANCGQVQADYGLAVLIERTEAADNYYAFTGCMRGPDIAAERATVLAILSSVHFA